MLSPVRNRELGTLMVYSQYKPCIPCLAIALSLPISPVEKCAGLALSSLNRTLETNQSNTLAIYNGIKSYIYIYKYMCI